MSTAIASTYFDFATIAPEEAVVVPTTAGAAWQDALVKSKQEICTFLNEQEDLVSFHFNTTAAFQRVFARIRQLSGSRPLTLLTTDLEYPGIITHLDETWDGRMVLAEISGAVWKGEASTVDEALRTAFLTVRPDVILISHVSRSTGWVLGTDLLEYFGAVDPRVVVVVDGAQALGNLSIDAVAAVRKLSDLYIFSSHKWLCGKPTLGVVLADARWRVEDPAQGYSSRAAAGGSGNMESLLSLPSRLRGFEETLGSQHLEGRRLALEGLIRRAKTAGYGIPKGLFNDARSSGLVVLSSRNGFDHLKPPSGDYRFHVFEALHWRPALLGGKAAGPRFLLSPLNGPLRDNTDPVRSIKLVEARVPIPAGGVTTARFCFHTAFHSGADIEQLAHRLCQIRGGV